MNDTEKPLSLRGMESLYNLSKIDLLLDVGNTVGKESQDAKKELRQLT